MNEKYEKIINLPHHVSKTRAQMSRSDRAAQFAPYSALTGYENAIEETARLTDRKHELDEYEKEKINSAIISIMSSPTSAKARITFFRPDTKKEGGAYVSTTDEIGKIDEVGRTITLLSGKIIRFDDILKITKISE